MLKIALCDDENYYREYIGYTLDKCLNRLNMNYELDVYNSGKLISNLGKNVANYDIIFLDINMDEQDGIETAKIIRRFSTNVYIVFITAYVSYALEGYKVNAVRYLLKENNNFEATLMECMDSILHKINFQGAMIKFSFVEGEKNIALDKIIYIESKLHKLEFFIMKDKIEKYSIYEKLDVVENLLKDSGFVRIHQSYLVNMKYIQVIGNYKVILNTGLDLSVPKSKYKTVKDIFIAYKGVI